MPATCSARSARRRSIWASRSALLIFETFDAFDQARLALRDGTFVKFGEETGPVAMPTYGAYPLHARRGRDAGRAGRLFADPGRLGQPGPVPEHGAAGLVAARQGHRGVLRQGRGPMASRSAPNSRPNNPTLLVLDREFETQSVDPMFLEPESGLGWYDGKSGSSNSCSACSRPTRRRSRSRICSARPARLQARAHQRPVHLYRRRLRRPRSHAVRALCGAGGDVLSRPAGAAGA